VFSYVLFYFVSPCDLCHLVYCCTKLCIDIASAQSVHHKTYAREHYGVHKSLVTITIKVEIETEVECVIFHAQR
jgi:hypothetical protein